MEHLYSSYLCWLFRVHGNNNWVLWRPRGKPKTKDKTFMVGGYSLSHTHHHRLSSNKEITIVNRLVKINLQCRAFHRYICLYDNLERVRTFWLCRWNSSRRKVRILEYGWRQWCRRWRNLSLRPGGCLTYRREVCYGVYHSRESVINVCCQTVDITLS